MKIVKTILALMMALSLTTELSANSGVSSLKQAKKILSQVGQKVGQTIAVSALGLALVATPLQYADAQGQAVEELNEVVADDVGYRHSAMLLRVSIPPAAPAEGEVAEGVAADEEAEATEAAFHLAFIGGDGKGNSFLIGRERQSGINIGTVLEDVSEASLFAWDGIVSAGLSVRKVDSFEDFTGDGLYNVVLLQVEGLDLSTNYTAVALGDGFPYADQRELEVLTYRLVYHPYLKDDELPGDNFTLRWLRCNSVPNPNQFLGLIGFGITTCGIVDNEVANGALIIDDGRLVAFQSLESNSVVDENDKPLAWLATDISTRAIEFSQSLGEIAAAVEAKDKLTTTWGAIKRGQ